MKDPTNKMDKNAVAVALTNSHCKEEVVGYVQQNSPWLYPCFCPFPHYAWDIFATGKSVNRVGDVTANFHFNRPNKVIQVAKT